MKKFLEKKWLALAYGFLVIAVGALTIAYAIIDPSVVTTVMSISIAVSLFILGAANIALALVAHTTEFFQKSLLVGSATIAVGVLLCVNRTLIGEFIALLLGVFFIAFAVVALIKFILFIVYKENITWIVLYAIFMLVAAAAGILILCFKQESNQVIYVIIGSAIALAGLFEIVASARAIIVGKKVEKELQKYQPADGNTQPQQAEVQEPAQEPIQQPVDVEVIEHKEEPAQLERKEEESEEDKAE